MPRSWFRSALLATLPRSVQPGLMLLEDASPRRPARPAFRRARLLSVETLETRRLLNADSGGDLYWSSAEAGLAADSSMPADLAHQDEPLMCTADMLFDDPWSANWADETEEAHPEEPSDASGWLAPEDIWLEDGMGLEDGTEPGDGVEPEDELGHEDEIGHEDEAGQKDEMRPKPDEEKPPKKLPQKGAVARLQGGVVVPGQIFLNQPFDPWFNPWSADLDAVSPLNVEGLYIGQWQDEPQEASEGVPEEAYEDSWVGSGREVFEGMQDEAWDGTDDETEHVDWTEAEAGGLSDSAANGSTGTESDGSTWTESDGFTGTESNGFTGTESDGFTGTESGGFTGTESDGSTGTESDGSTGTESDGSIGTESESSTGTQLDDSAGSESDGSTGAGADGSTRTESDGATGTVSDGSMGKGADSSTGTGSDDSTGTEADGSAGTEPDGGGVDGTGEESGEETTLSIEVFGMWNHKVVSEVYEGQGVSVAVTLTGATAKDGEYVDIYADANFDGKINKGGYGSESRGRENGPDSDGKYRFYFILEDDGPSPGNGTPQDTLTIYASYGKVIKSTQIVVKNVAPRIAGVPSVTETTDDRGRRVVSVVVPVFDPSVRDRITARVDWSDNQSTEGSLVVHESLCGDLVSRSIEVKRVLEDGGNAVPVLLQVWDDDTGSDTVDSDFASFNFGRLDVGLNNDDDNLSGTPDLAERIVQGEDDLRKLDLSPLLRPQMTTAAGEFYFSYDSSQILVWETAERQKLLRPRSMNPEGPEESFPGSILVIPYAGQTSVFVEGIGGGQSSITLAWLPNESLPSPSTPPCDALLAGMFGGSVDVAVWSIDLDIDSDNDGIIQNSEWEEELENHAFALGKLLYWQPQNELPKVEDVEMQLLLPTGLDPQLTVTLKGKRNEGVSSGHIDVLDYKHNSLGRTEFTGPVGTFTLSKLGYSAGTGLIKLFIKQPLTVNSPKTLTAATVQGKPDNRIEAILNLSHEIKISDEVKILIVRQLDFFDSVNSLQHLRNAGASQAVYSGGSGADGVMSLADGKIFTMRYIEIDEMEHLIEKDTFGGMSEELKTLAKGYIRSYLYNSRPLPYPEKLVSFQAGLYRDYVTGNYVLAYRGTELGVAGQQIPDWIVNVSQALTGDDASYEAGILLAWALNSMDFTKSKLFKLTGHSLGGGLASAASTVNSIPADLFNAAGVHPRSLVQDDGTPIIPGTAVPSKDEVTLLISHFFVEFVDDASIAGDTIWNTPDILTFLSLHTAALPKPMGRMIGIEGLYNLNDPALVISGISVLNNLPADPADLLDDSENWILGRVAQIIRYFGFSTSAMISSHSFDSIFFGLLHRDDGSSQYWNAYDGVDPRAR